MGWLSKLGNIAEIAGLVAAPFTGGGSLALTAASKGAKVASAASKVGKIASAASTIGKVAGDMSGARAGARVAEQGLNADYDRLALERAAQEQRGRATDENSAIRGGLLEGVKDAEVATNPDGSRSLTGGLRPSAIAGGSAMGKQFKDDALARLVADNSTPELTKRPEAGNLDRFLNVLSGVAGIADVAGNLRQGMRPPLPNIDPSAKVSRDPISIVGATPNVDSALDPASLPPQSTYRPRFTKRF